MSELLKTGFKLSVDKTGKDQLKANYANAYIGFGVGRYHKGAVAGSGRMDYDYDGNQRSGVFSRNTLDAIINHERRATTRYEEHGSIDYWKSLKVNDVIKWKNEQEDFVFAKITKALTRLSDGTTAKEWSKKEGWSEAYFEKNVRPNIRTAYQLEFEPVALSSSGVYLLDAMKAGLPVNYHIEPTKDTVAFVSVSSEGIHNQRTFVLANKVLKAGGKIIMDQRGQGYGQSHSSFNIKGEGAVQDMLGDPTSVSKEGFSIWTGLSKKVDMEISL